MRKRKPKFGECRKCGRAVVRPPVIVPTRDDEWIGGHRFVFGRLVDVRCFQHEPDDGRMPEAV